LSLYIAVIDVNSEPVLLQKNSLQPSCRSWRSKSGHIHLFYRCDPSSSSQAVKLILVWLQSTVVLPWYVARFWILSHFGTSAFPYLRGVCSHCTILPENIYQTLLGLAYNCCHFVKLEQIWTLFSVGYFLCCLSNAIKFTASLNKQLELRLNIQGGSNMTGTDCV
jgi:hypothetical protein